MLYSPSSRLTNRTTRVAGGGGGGGGSVILPSLVCQYCHCAMALSMLTSHETLCKGLFERRKGREEGSGGREGTNEFDAAADKTSAIVVSGVKKEEETRSLPPTRDLASEILASIRADKDKRKANSPSSSLLQRRRAPSSRDPSSSPPPSITSSPSSPPPIVSSPLVPGFRLKTSPRSHRADGNAALGYAKRGSLECGNGGEEGRGRRGGDAEGSANPQSDKAAPLEAEEGRASSSSSAQLGEGVSAELESVRRRREAIRNEIKALEEAQQQTTRPCQAATDVLTPNSAATPQSPTAATASPSSSSPLSPMSSPLPTEEANNNGGSAQKLRMRATPAPDLFAALQEKLLKLEEEKKEKEMKMKRDAMSEEEGEGDRGGVGAHDEIGSSRPRIVLSPIIHQAVLTADEALSLLPCYTIDAEAEEALSQRRARRVMGARSDGGGGGTPSPSPPTQPSADGKGSGEKDASPSPPRPSLNSGRGNASVSGSTTPLRGTVTSPRHGSSAPTPQPLLTDGNAKRNSNPIISIIDNTPSCQSNPNSSKIDLNGNKGRRRVVPPSALRREGEQKVSGTTRGGGEMEEKRRADHNNDEDDHVNYRYVYIVKGAREEGERGCGFSEKQAIRAHDAVTTGNCSREREAPVFGDDGALAILFSLMMNNPTSSEYCRIRGTHAEGLAAGGGPLSSSSLPPSISAFTDAYQSVSDRCHEERGDASARGIAREGQPQEDCEGPHPPDSNASSVNSSRDKSGATVFVIPSLNNSRTEEAPEARQPSPRRALPPPPRTLRHHGIDIADDDDDDDGPPRLHSQWLEGCSSMLRAGGAHLDAEQASMARSRSARSLSHPMLSPSRSRSLNSISSALCPHPHTHHLTAADGHAHYDASAPREDDCPTIRVHYHNDDGETMMTTKKEEEKAISFVPNAMMALVVAAAPLSTPSSPSSPLAATRRYEMPCETTATTTLPQSLPNEEMETDGAYDATNATMVETPPTPTVGTPIHHHSSSSSSVSISSLRIHAMATARHAERERRRANSAPHASLHKRAAWQEEGRSSLASVSSRFSSTSARSIRPPSPHLQPPAATRRSVGLRIQTPPPPARRSSCSSFSAPHYQQPQRRSSSCGSVVGDSVRSAGPSPRASFLNHHSHLSDGYLPTTAVMVSASTTARRPPSIHSSGSLVARSVTRADGRPFTIPSLLNSSAVSIYAFDDAHVSASYSLLPRNKTSRRPPSPTPPVPSHISYSHNVCLSASSLLAQQRRRSSPSVVDQRRGSTTPTPPTRGGRGEGIVVAFGRTISSSNNSNKYNAALLLHQHQQRSTTSNGTARAASVESGVRSARRGREREGADLARSLTPAGAMRAYADPYYHRPFSSSSPPPSQTPSPFMFARLQSERWRREEAEAKKLLARLQQREREQQREEEEKRAAEKAKVNGVRWSSVSKKDTPTAVFAPPPPQLVDGYERCFMTSAAFVAPRSDSAHSRGAATVASSSSQQQQQRVLEQGQLVRRRMPSSPLAKPIGGVGTEEASRVEGAALVSTKMMKTESKVVDAKAPLRGDGGVGSGGEGRPRRRASSSPTSVVAAARRASSLPTAPSFTAPRSTRALSSSISSARHGCVGESTSSSDARRATTGGSPRDTPLRRLPSTAGGGASSSSSSLLQSSLNPSSSSSSAGGRSVRPPPSSTRMMRF